MNFLKNKLSLIVLILIILGVAIAIKQSRNTSTLPEGCRPNDNFSQTTGQPCKEDVLSSCQGEDLYDKNTGEPCSSQ